MRRSPPRSAAPAASATTSSACRSASRTPPTWSPTSSPPCNPPRRLFMLAVDGHAVRLDGGVATELEHAGVPMTAPWWTTAALINEDKRRVLRSVHAEYL